MLKQFKSQNLTGIRAIAVLLVFTAHTPIRHIIGDFGQEAVYIFFFLSAYLLTISLEKQNLKTFWNKRFWRIYPLYFILIILLGFLNKYSITDILLNLSFLQQLNDNFIIDVSWSLIIEVKLYLILPLLVYGLKKYRWKLLIPLIIIPYLLRFGTIEEYLIRVASGSMKVVYGNFWEFLDMFAIASFIAINRQKIKSLTINSRLETILQLMIVILFLITPKIIEIIGINRAISIIVIMMPLYTVLISGIFGMLIRNTEPLNRILSNRILLFYGTISYSFYLIHIPILKLMKTTPFNPIIQGTIGFLIITLIAYILYKVVEERFIR